MAAKMTITVNRKKVRAFRVKWADGTVKQCTSYLEFKRCVTLRCTLLTGHRGPHMNETDDGMWKTMSRATDKPCFVMWGWDYGR